MTEDELLAGLLEAVHAAVFGYGVLGARLRGAEQGLAQEGDDALRLRRDALAAELRRRGAAPPAARAGYDIAVADRAQAVALAVRLEEGLAARWRDLVGATDDPALRSLGAAGLQEAAVRATRWRLVAGTQPATVAQPGLAG